MRPGALGNAPVGRFVPRAELVGHSFACAWLGNLSRVSYPLDLTVWPAVLGADAKAAHVLSDQVGDSRDLAFLATALRDDPPTSVEVLDRVPE